MCVGLGISTEWITHKIVWCINHIKWYFLFYIAVNLKNVVIVLCLSLILMTDSQPVRNVQSFKFFLELLKKE